MILHHIEQGSPEWIAVRLGIPTASEFHRIVTPGGKLSSQADDYAHRLIAERLLNRQLDSLEHLEWVSRGKEMEPEAVAAYEFSTNIATGSIGFITTDDGLIGCSPDRLAGENGLLEIKCPAPNTHIGYLLAGPGDKYKPQVQGQLYVSEREFVDLWSYHPEMPPIRIRTERDDAYIELLATALRQFNERLAMMMETVRARGYFDDRRRLTTAVDELAAEQAEP
jgi:hypothetical protein